MKETQRKSNDDDESDVEDEEQMEEDDDDGEVDPIKSIKAFKKLVVKTLEDNQMNDKRACKMEIMDFLNLLNIMN